MSDNQAAIALLDEWLNDDSGYDDEAWPILKAAIEVNRMSERRRFDDDGLRDEETMIWLQLANA